MVALRLLGSASRASVLSLPHSCLGMAMKKERKGGGREQGGENEKRNEGV